ncbi:MAG: methyltransferase domain-containing protein [Planctomycetales bacterium]|nr:methyltransferase domain-containing protein [Planctomycetales bacterium]NIM07651.1 methyltransferase domain-containing protein [Planctomycetales bacterium]NIN07157.1 methyltransferase domain-containing protein [Planctomycetales bacterium]NIN76250.1 methyltransferase domain-containing protein [Planctomycetales bacterium]NIO33466.1 methyltransferase domain-containing protein [Planctomycetales bacterium]
MDRVLEPEVMDSFAEAVAYDAMDHGAVNRAFVADLCDFGGPDSLPGRVLDIGTGTGRIPIELCLQLAGCTVLGIDLSSSMIELGRQNIVTAGLPDRVELALADAKQLPYDEGQFDVTISNSIVHHVPDPRVVLAEAVRVTAADGILFFRDLLRPPDDAAVRRLVRTYAAAEDEGQQRLFEDSLRASLTLLEIRDIVAMLGYDPAGVQTTSDRHWTWAARKLADRRKRANK